MPLFRTFKLILSLFSIGLLGAAVLCLGWAFTSPCPTPLPQHETKRPAPRKTASTGQDRSITLAQLEPLWNRSLQGPLFDPPPQPALPSAPRRPVDLPIKVLGTVVEADYSMAVLQYGGENAQVKKVGDFVGPESQQITIHEVYLDEVVVQQRGHATTLPVIK